MRSVFLSTALGLGAMTLACEGEPSQAPAPATADSAGTLRLVYSNNLNGEIEPCG